MSKRFLLLALGLSVVASAGSCGNENSNGTSAEPLVIFAAASLTDVFEELAVTFEAAHPEIDVQMSTAGSSALREQILEGAPADVFASANLATMAEVEAAGDVSGQPAVFARNRLQIAVPAGNPGDVNGLDDFAHPELLIGLCIEGVPCGDLARQVFVRAGLVPLIDTNEPDVRALLTKLEADELDAGVVYITDVMAAGDLVDGIEIPAQFNVEAAYPIAKLNASPRPNDADAFIALVLSDAGQEILARHGFSAP